MTPHRRSGTGKTVYLDYISTVGEQMTGIIGRRLSYPYIVDALIGGVAVAVYITVKYNDGYSRIIHLLDDRRYGIGLIGSGDDDVETVISKIAYVGNLLFIAVIGRAYFNRSLGMKHNLALNLLVHLGAPVIIAALRNTYAIFGFLLT